MSERNDRRIPDNRLLILTVTAITLLVAAAGAYLWFRASRSSKQTAEPAAAAPAAPVQQLDDTLPATLYVPQKGKLIAVSSAVRRQPDAQLEARETVLALLGDERGGSAAVLGEVRLRALYLDGEGTAYLDLAEASPNQRDIRASAWDELLAVYALVNTVTQNVPEVRAVRFLVDGRQVQTLAGHLDLERAYVKRMDMVAQ